MMEIIHALVTLTLTHPIPFSTLKAFIGIMVTFIAFFWITHYTMPFLKPIPLFALEAHFPSFITLITLLMAVGAHIVR